jgi:polysaccharide deacetylase 2 family uncharacterized protein YibQ
VGLVVLSWVSVLAFSAPRPPPPPSAVIALPRLPPPPAPQKPLQTFARPFDKSDKRPRVALILSNETDHSTPQMTAALNLPGAVTLALTPYTRGLPDWAERARQSGHEVLIGLPMEPGELSITDPGPLVLLSTAEPAVNKDRLEKALRSATGFVGVLPLEGERFLNVPEKLRPVLEEVNRRGLLFVDRSGRSAVAETGGELPRLKIDQVVDGDTREALERRLAELEGAAKRAGRVIGLANASPAMLEKITAWAAGLEARGVALAPVTAMLP